MMRKFAFAILAAALAVPTMAAPESSTEAPKPAKPKKICKHIATTESRMGTTICKTAEEWADSVEQDRAKLDNVRRPE